MKVSVEQLEKMSPEERRKTLTYLEQLGYYLKYSSALTTFFENAYPFQRAYFNSTGEMTVTGLIAGNRVGKSEAAAAFTACAATGVWPEWYTGYRFKDKPIKIFVCGSTSQQLRVGMQEKLYGTEDRNDEEGLGSGFLPKDSIVRFNKGRDGSVGDNWIAHSSGGKSWIGMLQYSQSDAAFQGASVDLVVIDEEPGEKFFQQALKRVSIAPHGGPGKVICAFTPEQAEEGFVMKQFWNLPTVAKYGEELETPVIHKFEGEDRTVDVLDYNIFENTDLKYRCINAGWPSVEHIDEQMQKTMLYGTPAYLHETIKWGKPMLGGGIIYNVDPDMITYDPYEEDILDGWMWGIGTDFGFTRDDGSAVLGALDPVNDIIYITEEWKGKSNTVRDFGKNISLDPTAVIFWPRDGNRGGFKGTGSTASQLIDMGYNLHHSPFLNPIGPDGKKHAEIEPGLTEVRSRMFSGRIKISHNCPLLLEEIADYKYGTDGRPKKGSVDHLCDALRYLVMSLVQDLGEPLYGSERPYQWEDEEEEENDFHNYY